MKVDSIKPGIMIRRRYYVPNKEINRYYGKQGDFDIRCHPLPCDFKEQEEEDEN